MLLLSFCVQKLPLRVFYILSLSIRLPLFLSSYNFHDSFLVSLFLFDSRVRSFFCQCCFTVEPERWWCPVCPFLIFFSLPLDSFLVFRSSTATFSLCFVDVTLGMTCHVLHRETESRASQEKSQDTLSNNKQRSEKKRETTKRHDSEKMEGKVTWQENWHRNETWDSCCADDDRLLGMWM